MKAILTAAALLVCIGAAHAQQPQATPLEQALSARVWNEVNGNIQCNVAMIGTAKQIEELQAKIADLEAKLKPGEPKQGAPK